jgi:hypothetical protein
LAACEAFGQLIHPGRCRVADLRDPSGALIIVFLVLEPNGQARLWQINKQS